MSDEQRAWLAIQFTACQQKMTRHNPLACERRRGIKACIASMDPKTHTEYTVFLGNVARWGGGSCQAAALGGAGQLHNSVAQQAAVHKNSSITLTARNRSRPVRSMCLFLQNQRFQELMSRLVNDMAAIRATH